MHLSKGAAIVATSVLSATSVFSAADLLPYLYKEDIPSPCLPPANTYDTWSNCVYGKIVGEPLGEAFSYRQVNGGEWKKGKNQTFEPLEKGFSGVCDPRKAIKSLPEKDRNVTDKLVIRYPDGVCKGTDCAWIKVSYTIYNVTTTDPNCDPGNGNRHVAIPFPNVGVDNSTFFCRTTSAACAGTDTQPCWRGIDA